MKNWLFTLRWLCFACIPLSLSAQELSVHRPNAGQNWHSNVRKGEKPTPISCAAGAYQYYRLPVSYSSLQRNYLYDTIRVNQKELSDGDIANLEADANRRHEQAMDDLLDQEHRERVEAFADTHLEELEETCLSEFQDLMNEWDSEDYQLCIPDCPSAVEICHMYYENRSVVGARVGYRLKYNRHHHPAEFDDEAQAPYEVEVAYDLEYYAEAWVYFKIMCICDSDGTVSVRPEEDAALWAGVDLVGADMKPFYAPGASVSKRSAWLPVLAGLGSAGTLVYFATKDTKEDEGCGYQLMSDVTPASCDLPNGAIAISSGAAEPLSYMWSSGQTGPVISQLVAGTYMVTVSSAGSECSEVLTVDVPNQNPEFSVELTATEATCSLADGAVTASVVPAGDYTYQWSTGATTPAISDLSPGTYSLTVSAGGNCLRAASATVAEEPFEPDLELTVTPSACGSNTGTVRVDVIPIGGYAYIWSNGATVDQLSGLAPGDYSVTVSVFGAPQCAVSASVTVPENDPEFVLEWIVVPADCGQSNGQADVTPSIGASYSYQWAHGPTTDVVTDLAPGTYFVTVTLDGTDCAVAGEIEIPENPPAITISFETTDAGCGLSDGAVNAVVGPPGEYLYAWSGGQTTPGLTGLAPGTYSLTVTIPGTECAREASVVVQSTPPPFTVTVVPQPAGCGVADGSAEVLVDPAGEYAYTWSDGQTTPQAVGLASGTYTVTVSLPGTTCQEVVQVDIGELPPAFAITFTTTPAGCTEPTGTATAMVDIPGMYDFIWSTGAMGPVLTDVPPGSYSVTATLSGSSCATSATVVVPQDGGPTGVNVTTTPADCGLSNGGAQVFPDPIGVSYSFAWSNGQTGHNLMEVAGGTYTVTITNESGCTLAVEVEVEELPADWINVLVVNPANCQGGGDVRFSLVGSGEYILDISGPGGMVNGTYPFGFYALENFFNVTAGTYQLIAQRVENGPECVDTVTVVVEEINLPPDPMDDLYETPGNTPVSGNVLDNDSGLDLNLTAVSNELGGTVNFSADGAFTFTPDPGFEGDASFTYTVTDACGFTATAVVTLVVESITCDFTTTFESVPASCGLEDGEITAVVAPAGIYTYQWSHGATGQTVTDLGPGLYEVTITDVEAGCDLQFVTELGELPGEYVSELEVTQPVCGGQGEIAFVVMTNSPDPLIMSVTHPNGSDLFFIEPGSILLSDYVSITPGVYEIEIVDAGAGPECAEIFSVELIATPMAELVVEAVIPPSTPSAMDGSVILVAVTPGELPYMIFVNDLPYGEATDHAFVVDGLGVGEYNIQIIDANGCPSNMVFVIVPPPDDILSLSIGQMTGPAAYALPEQAVDPDAFVGRPWLMIAWRQFRPAWNREWRLAWSPGHFRGPAARQSVIQAAGLVEPYRTTLGRADVSLQGGPGVFYLPASGDLRPFALLEADLRQSLGRSGSFSATLGMMVTDRFVRPVAGCRMEIPFHVVKN